MPPRPYRSASRPTNQRRCASLRVRRTLRNRVPSCPVLAVFMLSASHKTFQIVNVILRQALSTPIMCDGAIASRAAALCAPTENWFYLFVLKSAGKMLEPFLTRERHDAYPFVSEPSALRI